MSIEPGTGIPLPPPITGREGRLDPFPWYRENRRESPLQYDSGRECWDIFGYDAVDSVLTDPETFSSSIIGRDIAFQDSLLGMDPPRHTRIRESVAEYFEPGAVRELEPRIQETADDLLDRALDGGMFDVVNDFAYQLPILTIADLLGVPGDRRDEFKQWSDEVIAGPQLTGGDLDSLVETRSDALLNIGEFFHEIIEHRRRNPDDDLISQVVRIDHDFTYNELLHLFGLLLVAGNVTTTNLITNAVRCFAQRPTVLDEVMHDDEVLATAVEEVLRYRSPVQQTARIATRDTEVEGHTIEEGEPVVAWLASANRDPEVFDSPQEFRHTREPNPHVAFGRGIHICLGAPLARLEAQTALSTLFDRVTDIEPVETELTPVSATFLHGVTSYPVRVET